jgi:hypothetical protein
MTAMGAMTGSAVRLAREALAVGERALPRYSPRRSRRDDVARLQAACFERAATH